MRGHEPRIPPSDRSSSAPPVTMPERVAALRSLSRIERELGYVDERVSEAELPEPRFEGECYEAEVPDTLDLTDNARFAINAYTRMIDPALDYRFFGNATFGVGTFRAYISNAKSKAHQNERKGGAVGWDINTGYEWYFTNNIGINARYRAYAKPSGPTKEAYDFTVAHGPDFGLTVRF